jgi:hypothetical protein
VRRAGGRRAGAGTRFPLLLEPRSPGPNHLRWGDTQYKKDAQQPGDQEHQRGAGTAHPFHQIGCQVPTEMPPTVPPVSQRLRGQAGQPEAQKVGGDQEGQEEHQGSRHLLRFRPRDAVAEAAEDQVQADRAHQDGHKIDPPAEGAAQELHPESQEGASLGREQRQHRQCSNDEQGVAQNIQLGIPAQSDARLWSALGPLFLPFAFALPGSLSG